MNLFGLFRYRQLVQRQKNREKVRREFQEWLTNEPDFQNLRCPMTNTQEKINTEQDAMTILERLLQFQGEDYIWTAGIFADNLRWERERADNAIKWLLRYEYAYDTRMSYKYTELGRAHFEDIRGKPVIITDVQAFKTEALTNVKQGNGPKKKYADWQRSEIENGVLPRTGPQNGRGETPEEVLFAKEEKKEFKKQEKKASKMLGLTLGRFRELFDKGLITMCKGIGNGYHLGRFHRNGKGRRNLCVECTKEKRK